MAPNTARGYNVAADARSVSSRARSDSTNSYAIVYYPGAESGVKRKTFESRHRASSATNDTEEILSG